MRLASGTNRVMLKPDGRRSHTAVDGTDQLILLAVTVIVERAVTSCLRDAVVTENEVVIQARSAIKMSALGQP